LLDKRFKRSFFSNAIASITIFIIIVYLNAKFLDIGLGLFNQFYAPPEKIVEINI